MTAVWWVGIETQCVQKVQTIIFLKDINDSPLHDKLKYQKKKKRQNNCNYKTVILLNDAIQESILLCGHNINQHSLLAEQEILFLHTNSKTKEEV